MSGPGQADADLALPSQFVCLGSTQISCAESETMSGLPVNVAVFFGKVDKRPAGWYWTPISDDQIPHSGSTAGPFETKAAAVEDANRNVRERC